MFQTKEQDKTPEKELSEMEAGNLPGGEFNYYGCKDFQRTWGKIG